MLPGEVPSGELLPTVADAVLLDLYTEVLGELVARGREEPRTVPASEERPPGPLVAVDDDVLLDLYRGVHDELMSRQAERPGVWERPGDPFDDDATP